MRDLSLLILALLLHTVSFAQYQTNIWIGGIKGGINFNGDSAASFLRSDNYEMWRATSSICNANGDLLFYTNGFRIFNMNFEIMENGDSLNMGDYLTFGYDLSPTPDGALIIPMPNTASKYYTFYMDLNWIDLNSQGGLYLFPTHVFYSIVDMSLEGGIGAVENGVKNIPILNDTLTQFGMKAVKHGNGRDWWLICHEYGSNGYYTFLIDTLGIHGPFKQDIGTKYEYINAQVASIMKFTEDGSKFLNLTFDSNRVELFDFDRCTGQLYNYSSFKVDSDMAYSWGASFSPNQRYVYVSINFDEIRQYDLEATDISSSQVVIGIDDGIGDPFPAHYYLHQLGPDGKIYIVSYDGAHSLHVINHPDSAGLECNFVQRGLELLPGSQWVASAPNVVNYSLGPLEGSECDTLVSAIQPTQSVFTIGIYPNPCYQSSQLSISGANEKAEIFLYNTFGQLLYQNTAFPNNNFIHAQLPVKNLESGMYLVKIKMGRKEYAQKLFKR